MATDKSNTKSDRRKCWDARDAYFKCDDEGKGEVCEDLRKRFLALCPKVWVMEEFQRLSLNLHDQKSKPNPPSQILGENEVVQLLRTSRETVEELMGRSSANLKIGQSECKSVRDLIGASLVLSPSFHPPSEPILEEFILLVDTLMIALDSTKVPVESLILFGTALVQILVMGPCNLKLEVCPQCGNLNDSRELVKAAHIKVQQKYNVKMDSLSSSADTLLTKILSSECLVPVERTDSFELTLCYAFVMSSTRLRNLGATIQLEILVSSDIYDVIFKECSKYSKLTTMAFKTLASWLEKVSEFGLNLSREVTHETFKITMSSWEVSLSGVRKDNAKAFSTLLLVDSGRETPILPSPADLLNSIIKQQLWTDVSKYYTITELVGLLTAPKVLEIYADEIVKGITTSFGNNQLAAAGAHLYESLLRQLTLSYWEKYFFNPILELICEIDGPAARQLRKLETDKVSRSANIEKVRTIQLNILNYWLRITANIFPDAMMTLLRETYGKLIDSQFKRHDHLSFLASGVLFISRKKGLWNPKDDLTFPNMSTYRGEVTTESFFKTISVSCKISDDIRPEEFNLILKFLKSHINVDSTRMRQEIIRSMKVFFHRFHVSITHHRKLQPDHYTLSKSREFLHELLDFLSENLIEDIPSGKRISYQRRITSLQIYLELLRSVNDVKNYKFDIKTTECAQLIQAWHTDPQQQKMLANCIDDRTDTVQNTAFSILKERINETDCNTHSWLDIGIQKFQDPQSHVAQSGMLYILLECQSLYSCFGKPASVDDKLEKLYPGYKKMYSSSDAVNTPVTLVVFNIGLEIWEEFRSKPMELTKIKSLHGVINTITALVLKSGGPEAAELRPNFQEKLLEFVENVSDFCVSMFMNSTENKDCAPSFAEMGIAIRKAARLPDDLVDNDDDDDGTNDSAVNTSSDERLLVKHLWMNLKACCNFAANVDGTAETTQKSLDIITQVLRKCRHKGAIEAAGESLQHLIGAITRVPRSGEETISKKRTLPLIVLQDFLEDLASGRTAHKTSTTRRSAGLAIFVHHIVIGDAHPEKPLLKVALNQLMSALNTPVSDMHVSERDLPQAQTLHILKTLVADASLRVTVTPYINSVAKSALVYLTSTVWSVRNAALQLFGALVPILVGQESSLAQFHFFHKDLFESLVSFIETSYSASGHLLQAHNDAVPALVLLSRLTAPPTLLSSEELTTNVQRLKSIYFKLLGSEIMNVRQLAARGLSRMSSIDKPSLTVEDIKLWLEENPSQNAIHGSLLAVEFLWDRCQQEQSSSLQNALMELISFITPRLRSKLSSDRLLSINTNILNRKSDLENGITVRGIRYLESVPSPLDIDHARNELDIIVQQVLEKPSLSSEALQSVLTFLFDRPESPNDIIISALTAVKQIIILETAHYETDANIERLYKELKQWHNPSVRSAAYAVLFGLANIGYFKYSELCEITNSFVSDLKRCCSFVGDRDTNNQLNMAEALRFLDDYYHPYRRDFLNAALWFLQSEDSDVRDGGAAVLGCERLSHTECILKSMEPSFLQNFLKDCLMNALSLCDRLRFSDDELLMALGEVCGGCNVDLWRRENPYLEDWYVADTAYRELNTYLDNERFQGCDLQCIINALRLDEVEPFLDECRKLNLCVGLANVESAVVSSPYIQNHRKILYRAKLQDKCRKLMQD